MRDGSGLALLLGMLLVAGNSFGMQRSVIADRKRLSDIRSKIGNGHRFSSDDQKYVVSCISSTERITRIDAAMLLEYGAEEKLFPEERFKEICEAHVLTAVDIQADIFLDLYAQSLRLPLRETLLASFVKLKDDLRKAGLSTQEKQFLRRAAESRLFADRFFLAHFVIRKLSLDAEVGTFLTKAVQYEIRRSSDNERRCWQEVSRVLTVRLRNLKRR